MKTFWGTKLTQDVFPKVVLSVASPGVTEIARAEKASAHPLQHIFKAKRRNHVQCPNSEIGSEKIFRKVVSNSASWETRKGLEKTLWSLMQW